jgi:hypothetical protein
MFYYNFALFVSDAYYMDLYFFFLTVVLVYLLYELYMRNDVTVGRNVW